MLKVKVGRRLYWNRKDYENIREVVFVDDIGQEARGMMLSAFGKKLFDKQLGRIGYIVLADHMPNEKFIILKGQDKPEL